MEDDGTLAGVSEDHLRAALQRLEDQAAVSRSREEHAAQVAARSHPRDDELNDLLTTFTTRMPHETAIPFVELLSIQDPPVRGLFRKPVSRPRRTEPVICAHGWVVPDLVRKIYRTRPADAGLMGRLGLGVTSRGEPMFVLQYIPDRQLPEYHHASSQSWARIGAFDFDDSDISTSPLCSRSLGRILVENKCGAILETLRLHYDDMSVAPTPFQPPGSAVIFQERPAAADQANQLLAAIAEKMAQTLHNHGV